MQKLICNGDLRGICSEFGWLLYVTVEEDKKNIIQWYLDNDDGWQLPFNYSGTDHWLATKS